MDLIVASVILPAVYMTTHLKPLAILLITLTCAVGTGLKAQGSFGNSPVAGSSFLWSEYNGMAVQGGAVSFTPLQNINVSSITIWLDGFSGANGIQVNAGIYLNQTDSSGIFNHGTATSFPSAQILSFTTPAHNDGSLAPFTYFNPVGNPFNNPASSTVLLANTTYWLMILPSGPTGPYANGGDWVAGGTPTGDSVYNGSVYVDRYNGKYDASTVMPAFSINGTPLQQVSPVPEPGSVALLLFLSLILLARAVWKRMMPAKIMVRINQRLRMDRSKTTDR